MSGNSSGDGTLGGGGLLQLAAFGAEDLVLIADPEITFFNKVYKKYSNFAMESIFVPFTDIPQFNGISSIKIKKNGDMLSRLYFQVTLPYDINLVDSYWTNRVGFNLINRVELYIGQKLIDRLYGIWMHIWVELTHNTDMKGIISNMVGTTHNNGYSNGLPCNVPHNLIIPLPFSFCRHSGLAIPMNAIRNNQDISLKFYFEKKENCIQVGDIPAGDIVNPMIWGDYIFLETEENRLFVQKPLEYLIECTQHFERNLITGGTKSIRLPFNLSCKELFWVIYSNSRTGDKFTDFTYGNYGDTSMVKTVQFKFNSRLVFSAGPKDYNYFNYVQPYQHHQIYPDIGINCYSFALYPIDHSPSGFINFKHLSNAVMDINTYENGFIHIFAFSYNILQISKGEINLVYKY